MTAALGGDGTVAPVTVAVIDSGVNVPHPHLPAVAGGVALDLHGREHADYIDRLGHGTAVAAAIHEKAPEAGLFVIKVFDHRLATSVPVLIRAVDLALEAGARVVNLSLGTPNDLRERQLREAVERTREAGAILVSARELDGVRWLPGALPGAVGVVMSADQSRETVHVTTHPAGERVVVASPYPRPIPGVPVQRNLNGISFAVANATGVLAHLLSMEPDVRTADDVLDLVSDAFGGG